MNIVLHIFHRHSVRDQGKGEGHGEVEEPYRYLKQRLKKRKDGPSESKIKDGKVGVRREKFRGRHKRRLSEDSAAGGS